MKFLRGIWLNVIVALLMCSASSAAVLQISGFVTQADGNLIHASDWNTQIGQIYTYINGNLVNVFNLLSAKGSLLTYDGTNFQGLAVGSNGQFLAADSTQSNGIKWAAAVTTTALTTKGDTLTYDGASLQRLPVGTDGQVLTSRASASYGVDWESGGLPSGSIIMWSGSLGSIPAGFQLCNGTNGTPNLQGLFIVGAGNSSPPAANGMGLLNPGGPNGDSSAGTGLGPAHSHTVSVSASGYQPGAQVAIFNISGTSAASVTPRYYALAYIQKL